MFLPRNASKTRVREAHGARENRREIIKALSHRQVTRRDMVKMGLMTAAGSIVLQNGLSPFANSAYGTIPTGAPLSPLFGATPFSQPMPRFDVLERKDPSLLTPAPTEESNQTQQPLDPALPGVSAGQTGPVEGRPWGPVWAHQRWKDLLPRVAVEVEQAPSKVLTNYNPQVASQFNSGIDAAKPVNPRFHPLMPDQNEANFWTFNGSVPPKLMLGRYGEPILMRHHNRLPADIKKNAGFGIHTISTHEHNGHHGAENDGFTGAFFFPGQFYDYHYPIVHAGIFSINTGATDPRCGSPNDRGGVDKLPGDWQETMSTHWFHDHMFSFTSQNVYKGNAGMFNLYSSLDRGNEAVGGPDDKENPNLRLPSGSTKAWGNLEYDVNLMLADKAFDGDGQMLFDIFDFDGFLGDVMTVNLAYRPFFKVEPRRYRFRILNASVSRFFKVGLADASGKPVMFTQIANDGNLLPSGVNLSALDEQGIAERYDIVIDFSNYKNQNLYFVNLCEHQDGKKPAKDLSFGDALSGRSADPCVGKFLEFRVGAQTTGPDLSLPVNNGRELIRNPNLSQIPVSRERIFEFGRGGFQTSNDQQMSFVGPWGVKTDNNSMFNADYGRISAAPKAGTREVWTLKNGGGGWDHPIHIHFEEGQVLARNGSLSNVPAWERGRKDVYRLRPGGSITITMQFRDFGGMFMEHCHNTVHEDNAMLVRWQIDGNGVPNLERMTTPVPHPWGVEFREADETEPTAF
jgi:FtsP/CotA-like multicopper oxidase with cupredoxin domain